MYTIILLNVNYVKKYSRRIQTGYGLLLLLDQINIMKYPFFRGLWHQNECTVGFLFGR